MRGGVRWWPWTQRTLREWSSVSLHTYTIHKHAHRHGQAKGRVKALCYHSQRMIQSLHSHCCSSCVQAAAQACALGTQRSVGPEPDRGECYKPRVDPHTNTRIHSYNTCHAHPRVPDNVTQCVHVCLCVYSCVCVCVCVHVCVPTGHSGPQCCIRRADVSIALTTRH